MIDYPVLNARTFNQLGEQLGIDDTVDALRLFLNDMARKIVLISSSETTRISTRREAHSIKSSAATFGFERLAQIARNLETDAATAGADPLELSIAALRCAYEETARFTEDRLLPSLASLP